MFFSSCRLLKSLSASNKVFVYVIEIADEQFSPEVEVIQSFFAAGLFAEHLIQFAYQADRVTGLQWRELPEQFADADVGRRPQRAVRFSCQIFVEEQTGTFVGGKRWRCARGRFLFWRKGRGRPVGGMFP